VIKKCVLRQREKVKIKPKKKRGRCGGIEVNHPARPFVRHERRGRANIALRKEGESGSVLADIGETHKTRTNGKKEMQS